MDKTPVQYLEAGKIVNTHGVSGDVRIESWCDSPEVLAALKRLYLAPDGTKPLELVRASLHKGLVLAHFSGYDTMDDALKLKTRVVYADRADIPLAEGAHFIRDLIGLPVIDARSGRTYGVLADVINGAASDIYEVDTPDGKKAYMPVVREFVHEVKLGEAIYVKPIPGMFDDGPQEGETHEV